MAARTGFDLRLSADESVLRRATDEVRSRLKATISPISQKQQPKHHDHPSQYQP